MANARRDPELPCVTEALKDGQWAGQPAFVIGGGSSLKDFDFERLRGKGHALGANMAWKLPVCEVAFFKDQRLVNREKGASKAFGATEGQIVLLDEWARHSVAPEPSRRLFYVPKQGAVGVWGKSLGGGIIRAKNTGIEIANIADCLGCSPIMLLGYDLNTTGGNYTTYHDLYPKDWLPRCYGDVFQKWIAEWASVKDQIRGKVINLNPDSALDIFPKQDINEIA